MASHESRHETVGSGVPSNGELITQRGNTHEGCDEKPPEVDRDPGFPLLKVRVDGHGVVQGGDDEAPEKGDRKDGGDHLLFGLGRCGWRLVGKSSWGSV